MRVSATLLLCVGLTSSSSILLAQESGHAHHGGDSSAAPARAPKVFLDKSPKIVEYQLKRLSNAELLLIERSVDHPKYIPVYAAILSRAAIPSGQRRAAAEALAEIKKTSVVDELLAALDAMVDDNAETTRSARDLVTSLLSEPAAELSKHSQQLTGAMRSKSRWSRRAAMAGLLAADHSGAVRARAQSSANAASDFLSAVALLNNQTTRNALRTEVLGYLDDSQPAPVQQEAIRTLATIETDTADSFARMVELFNQNDSASSEDSAVRAEIVRALLKLPAEARDLNLAAALADRLVVAAEATPITQRTSDNFVDSVQLVESFLPNLPAEKSRSYRKRLQAIAVRAVRVRTIEEEMRYDVKYFAVEAGRPVEIILKNEDIMPHNLVVTLPGALKEVALDAAKMAPDQVTHGKQYVPASDKVLWATAMVPAGKSERLTFEAPAAVGEYPFVCTFPNHWMRMYGVMVVVADLDAWQKQPTAPADPIGNNRSFVRKWSMNDLAEAMEAGLRGRSTEIGARLLQEATCIQCHKLRGQGGAVGPDLTDVMARWKGDRLAVLQEILDPSHKIEPKYALQSVLTNDGKVYSGIIVAETKESISLVSTPEQKEPIKLVRDDIDEIVQSSKSIMPVGLLDQYTKDEIFEILAYLTGSQQP